MIWVPNVFILVAFVVLGSFSPHHEVPSLLGVGLMASALGFALLSRRSSRAQSIALMSVLGIMFYESLLSITRWLHIELVELPFLGGSEEARHFASLFFTFNIGLAMVGVAGAVIFALSIEVRKIRFPLAKLFPEMLFTAAPPEITGTVARLSQNAGISPPKVSLIDSGSVAAFITRSKQGYDLALSVGLLESLNRNELEACVAHELSHVKNRDFAVRSFATSARVALFAHPLSHLIEPAVYRSREFLADKTAAQLIGSRAPLISALSKIRESQEYVEAKSVPIDAACLFDSVSRNPIARFFDKHPGMDARIKALKELD